MLGRKKFNDFYDDDLFLGNLELEKQKEEKAPESEADPSDEIAMEHSDKPQLIKEKGAVPKRRPLANPEAMPKDRPKKKISEKKRDILYDVIKEKAVAWAVATASVDEIDEYNIRNATYMAMNRALSDLKTKIDYVLVDGDCIKDCKYPYSCVVKGDSKSASISAASILAKVTRDRYMLQLAEKYPQYQFEKHKGYGTALHIEMLKKYGASPVHRKTFIKKFV